MSEDEFDEIQSEADDIQASLNEASQHLMNATSCETKEDLKNNLVDAWASLKESLQYVEGLLLKAKVPHPKKWQPTWKP